MDELKPAEICVCGKDIYWDTAYGGYWAHLFGPGRDEKPHTPQPKPDEIWDATPTTSDNS